MWGGQQQYGGYGQAQQQGPSYVHPPPNQYGAPAQQPGNRPPPPGQYGAPGQGQYGAPPAGQYGAPPGHGAPPSGGQQYGSAPPPGQYGSAPPPGQYGSAPPPGQYGSAPPPGQYGSAPPPGQYGARPGQQQGYGSAPSPHTVGGYGGMTGGHAPPPPGVSPEIWTWFQNVDTDRSGKITSQELQQALMNGNWSPFNAETCRLMIGMFDRDRNGTIDVHEFAALWKYIQDWKACFDRFDTDRSGNIDANELGNAFRQFGYMLSPQFSQMVVRTFDRQKGGRCINFDDFIQACVMLKTLTDQFRVKDTSQNGTIRISYEEFLEMVLDTTIKK